MSDATGAGYRWTLESEDRLVYKADVRIEDTDNWSSRCEEIMMGGAYRGWVSNRGEQPVPWDQPSMLSLVVHQEHRAALFVEYRPETAEWPSMVDSAREQFTAIPYRGYSVGGFALSPDGNSVAVLEFWGGADGALAIVDPVRGERTVLARIAGLAGNESPLWSPDGRWVLIPTRNPVLVSTQEPMVVPLGLDEYPQGVQVDWWVEKGKVSLFGLAGAGLEQQVVRMSLETGTWESVCRVRVHDQEGLDQHRHTLVWPRMSASGDAVLVGSWLGPDAAYQEKYGSRSRLAVLHPHTGELESIFPAFVDDTVVEREHSGWHWTTRTREVPPFELGAALLDGAREPDTRERDGDDDLDQRREHLWAWWSAGVPTPSPRQAPSIDVPKLTSLVKSTETGVTEAAPPPFVRCYRIHADFPFGGDAFVQAQKAVDWMKDHGGETFHGVLVDGRGTRLSPEWIDVSAGWLSSDGDLAVITGTPTHSVVGLDEAYDLGTFDGRNLPFGGGGQWGPTPAESLAMPNRQVYFGDPRSGRFRITEVGPDVAELAVSDDGRRYATIERQGSGPRRLTFGATADRVPRTSIASLDFATDLRFSPDGNWLGLVSGGFALVDLDSRQVAHVPLASGWTTGWDWWPDSAPSIVQVIYDTETGVNRLMRIDLASGAAEQINELRVESPVEQGQEPPERSLVRPRMSADGRWMLAMSRAFQCPGRESEYTERMGLVLVDLDEGSTRPLHDAFLDGAHGPFGKNVLTIEHQSHEWIPQPGRSAYPPMPAALAMEGLTLVDLTSEQSSQLGEDSIQIASLLLEQAMGSPRFSGPGPGPLLSETVRYCATASATSEQWSQLDRWLSAVQSVLPEVSAQLPAAQVESWRALLGSVEMIRTGRAGEIDYVALERVAGG